jgi:hypothetical protein
MAAAAVANQVLTGEHTLVMEEQVQLEFSGVLVEHFLRLM